MSRVLPILFNTNMVRAILDGRKTVTRRLIKQKHNGRIDVGVNPFGILNLCEICETSDNGIISVSKHHSLKPPYQPGDILYVRETFGFQKCSSCEQCADCVSIGFEDEYKGEPGCYVYPANYGSTEDDSFPASMYKWHPSIHMPKAATRIFLKIKDIRVEKLQDMKEEDFKMEGIYDDGFLPTDKSRRMHPLVQGGWTEEAYRDRFIMIWNDTIKKSEVDRYGWEANPLVWVVEFERCDKPE